MKRGIITYSDDYDTLSGWGAYERGVKEYCSECDEVITRKQLCHEYMITNDMQAGFAFIHRKCLLKKIRSIK